MASLLELRTLVSDVAEVLGRASDLAHEISGARASRAPDPEHGDPGDPGEDGWPALGRLCNLFAALADVVRAAIPPEVDAALAEEERADDREPIAPGDYHYYEAR